MYIKNASHLKYKKLHLFTRFSRPTKKFTVLQHLI